ncbi:hypothetical protein M3J09_007576 [Ascochyta lentis]
MHSHILNRNMTLHQYNNYKRKKKLVYRRVQQNKAQLIFKFCKKHAGNMVLE